ncbi:hypothetical protein RZN05_10255 [Sphingomonas sp. HF-S4]|uniref:Helix-turn-helix transcriptional regulator n=1 Tax=Sphingomonas agrestis TaxID=3080540 RepID=A0ABU3Y7X5_9SPHN|nr:hypothetical protein [Sphingomonas sp. HF-S4]MDV3457364.1 hypothetical protein [Sphingomonas sp. HF-S4]
MPGNDPILVLILREMALRSTLVARLAMNGIDTCTAQFFDEKLPPSARGASLVLVTDQGAIDGHRGGTAALLCDPQWRMIVVLAPGDGAATPDPRLVHLTDADAAAALVRLLAERRVLV